MIKLRETDRLYLSPETIGYSDKLKEEGTFSRRVDLLTLGFAYAVRNNFEPAQDIKKREELIAAGSIDEDLRLAIESTATWYSRQRKWELPDSERKLLDFICRLGISGVRALKERWEGKTKSQIHLDIIQLAERPKET